MTQPVVHQVRPLHEALTPLPHSALRDALTPREPFEYPDSIPTTMRSVGRAAMGLFRQVSPSGR